MHTYGSVPPPSPTTPAEGAERLVVRPVDGRDHLAFVRQQDAASFLQTPAWGQVKTQWRAESLGWFDGPRLVGVGLVLHRPVARLRRLTLAYLAEGPVIDHERDLDDWLAPLAVHLRTGGAFALRVGPPVRTHTWSAAQVKAGLADDSVTRLTELPCPEPDPHGARLTRQLREAGLVPQETAQGFGTGHPQFVYELPLRHGDGSPMTEDDLLRGMNQQWRRNIKRAAEAGVRVSTSTDEADLRAFHELYVHTAERDSFTPRPLAYFTTMIAAMAGEDPERIELFLARHEGDLLAAAILVRVGRQAWYVYGASSTDKRHLRGSNACQWAMIRSSLASGCHVYSLRGITPTLELDDPLVGLVRFKVGTGGRAVRHVGEWDLPLRPVAYRAFTTLMRAREARRRPEAVAVAVADAVPPRTTVYGCDLRQAEHVRTISQRLGIATTAVGDDVSADNATVADGSTCVSVSHRAPLDADTLSALAGVGVRHVSTRSIGADHIDLDAASRLGMSVDRVSYSPDSVADFTVMSILMTLRHAKATVLRASEHDYRLNDSCGRELRDLTVGIVGTGRIGGAVAARLRGFGCTILTHDTRPTGVDGHVGLDDLVSRSDVVSLHVPLTEATHHLLDRRQIRRMKPHAVVVNTGRGALVDTVALLDALEDGHLGGAALDVLEGETSTFHDGRPQRDVDPVVVRLQRLPNVLVSPHTAYYTDHAVQDMVQNSLISCLENGKQAHTWTR